MSTSQPKLNRIEQAIRAANASADRTMKGIDAHKFVRSLNRASWRERRQQRRSRQAASA